MGASRTSHSRPGPDGTPQASWQPQGDALARTIAEAISGVVGRAFSLALGLNLSVMVFLPTEVPQLALFTCEVAATRPLALADTLPKVVALGLNDRLSELAARTAGLRLRCCHSRRCGSAAPRRLSSG